jgi:predicted nucleotidyltransferase
MIQIDTRRNFSKIEAMVGRLAEQFHPTKIILFGSYARGAAGPDSDVDLLVVIATEGSRRKLAIQMDIALADRDIPLDLLVVSPQEFNQYRDIAGSIIYPAVREGKVMYEQV